MRGRIEVRGKLTTGTLQAMKAKARVERSMRTKTTWIGG
jgi:hypothetical protein